MSKWTLAKVQAHFATNYIAEDGYDGVYLRETHGRTCKGKEEHAQHPAAVALVDVEDEASGGFPLCLACYGQFANESEEFRVSDPARVWQEILKGGTWFLYAPPGVYSKEGEWPYEP